MQTIITVTEHQAEVIHSLLLKGAFDISLGSVTINYDSVGHVSSTEIKRVYR